MKYMIDRHLFWSGTLAAFIFGFILAAVCLNTCSPLSASSKTNLVDSTHQIDEKGICDSTFLGICDTSNIRNVISRHSDEYYDSLVDENKKLKKVHSIDEHKTVINNTGVVNIGGDDE